MSHTPFCSKARKNTLIFKKENFLKAEITNMYLLASIKYDSVIFVITEHMFKFRVFRFSKNENYYI